MQDFWLATTVVLIATFACLAVHAGYELKMLQVAKGLGCDASTLALIQVGVADLLLGISQTLILTAFASPEASLARISVSGQKSTIVLFASQILFVFGICFVALSAATISLLWIQFATRTARLQKSEKYLDKIFLRLAVVYEFSFAFSVIMCASFGNMPLAQVISIPFGVIVMLWYAIGSRLMHKTLTNAMILNSKPEYTQMLKTIWETTLIVFIFLLLIIINGIFYGIFSFKIGWKENTPPDTVSAIAVLSQLTPIFFVGGIAGIQLYLHTARLISSSKLRRKSTPTPIHHPSPRVNASVAEEQAAREFRNAAVLRSMYEGAVRGNEMQLT